MSLLMFRGGSLDPRAFQDESGRLSAPVDWPSQPVKREPNAFRDIF